MMSFASRQERGIGPFLHVQRKMTKETQFIKQLHLIVFEVSIRASFSVSEYMHQIYSYKPRVFVLDQQS